MASSITRREGIGMKRNMHIVCGLLIALAMAWPAIGQDALEALQGYPRSGLQLISQESKAEGSTAFSPEAIPGIELRLMGEPTLEAYEYELETAEGVIVGLRQSEGPNDYLSGRSYLYEQRPQAHTPVDLEWAEEDRFRPGNQGRVLETLTRETGQLEFDCRTGWTPVEFMLALSPVDTPDFRGMEYGCPPDAIANHVTLNSTPHGDIEIEECVLREGDPDIYAWIVTNISFVWNGCGVCMLGVSNGGLHAVDQSGPSMWTFMETPGAWFWRAPLGSCGFELGAKAVFLAVVPGPPSIHGSHR